LFSIISFYYFPVERWQQNRLNLFFRDGFACRQKPNVPVCAMLQNGRSFALAGI
jgi:hypothetical protein